MPRNKASAWRVSVIGASAVLHDNRPVRLWRKRTVGIIGRKFPENVRSIFEGLGIENPHGMAFPAIVIEDVLSPLRVAVHVSGETINENCLGEGTAHALLASSAKFTPRVLE